MGFDQLLIERFTDPFPAALWAAVGAFFTHLWRRYRNRMTVLRWQAWHKAVAVSATDNRFGKIEVLYNNSPVHNVLFCTIEVENESSSDLANLDINVVFQDETTIYMSHGTVQGSMNELPFTSSFSLDLNKLLALPQSDPAYGPLLDRLSRRRDYRVPVLNRGGKLTIALLVQALPSKTPFVHLGCDYPGVKLLAQGPRQLFFGVDMNLAALMGFIVGVALVIYIGTTTLGSLTIAVAAFLIGSLGVMIGAAAVRGFRFLIRLLD